MNQEVTSYCQFKIMYIAEFERRILISRAVADLSASAIASCFSSISTGLLTIIGTEQCTVTVPELVNIQCYITRFLGLSSVMIRISSKIQSVALWNVNLILLSLYDLSHCFFFSSSSLLDRNKKYCVFLSVKN